MAITFNSIFLVILFCGSAAGTGTHLFPVKSQHGITALPSAASNGMCQTMVETQGYACVELTVTTQDGYILSMQRIPVGRSGGSAGDRAPVLLHHGLLSDGAVWLVLPPDQALAFILADNGFDVWIANGRGTLYSRGHTSLSPANAAYWVWSWDEMVTYDLPAMFRFVYNETGQKLHYVGHSQGTLMALAALSKCQLLDTWRSASLFAPISYMGQTTSQFVKVFSEIVFSEESFWLQLGEFNPIGAPELQLFATVCEQLGFDCIAFNSVVSGQDCCLNSAATAAMVSHGIQSSSTKNMIHFAQMVTNGTLAMYDYGDKDENRKHYGQPAPPAYDMKSIPNDFPLFLCHGGPDTLANVENVQLLLDSLKEHDQNELAVRHIDKYGHQDFLMAVDSKEEVYEPLMDFLRLH